MTSLKERREWMRAGCPIEEEVRGSVAEPPAEAAVHVPECRSFRLYVAPVRGVLMAQCGGCGEVVEEGGLERRPDKGEKSVDGVYDTIGRIVERMSVHGGGTHVGSGIGSNEAAAILLDLSQEHPDRHVKPWLQMGAWVIASMLNGGEGGRWIGQPPSTVRSSGWAFSFSPDPRESLEPLGFVRGPRVSMPSFSVEDGLVQSLAKQVAQDVDDLYTSRPEPGPAVELEPRYSSWASKVFHRLLDWDFSGRARP